MPVPVAPKAPIIPAAITGPRPGRKVANNPEKTDEELRNCLFLDNINNIPLPEQNEPWITADGIVFQYDKYEIAAGAYDVNFIISFDEFEYSVSFKEPLAPSGTFLP